MVSIGQYKMLPMAPNNSILNLGTPKPKIAFSIDSIVGGATNHNSNTALRQCNTNNSINLSPRSSSPDCRPTSPYSDDCNSASYPLELRNSDYATNADRNYVDFSNARNHPLRLYSNPSNYEPNLQYATRDPDRNIHFQHQSSPSPRNQADSLELHRKRTRLSSSSPLTVQAPLSPESSVKSLGRLSPVSPSFSQKQATCDSPTAIQDRQHEQQQISQTSSITNNNNNNNSNNNNNNSNSSSNSPAGQTKGPIMVPGIPAGLIRPFPVQPNNVSVNNDIKSMPSYMNGPEMQPNPHHILAAQFQMAAALAHHGQTAGGGHGFPPGGAGMPGHPHHSQFGNPNLVRESYPLYPWLLSRHGRIFPHRFPGHFLLQPFRKPKRVRTAFSPTQLLKLEHAFEGNHYVVGAERKTLAQTLSLTETQVKVWFQNRRTKHKRMQQEDDAKGGGGNNTGDRRPLNDCTQSSFDDDEDDDELIDMDDCPSDQEMDHHYR